MSRAYGWTSDGAIDRAEAAELRTMADWLLKGKPMRGLVADLTDRGISTVTGKPWAPIVVKRALINPRNEPILNRRYPRIVELLTDPARAKFTPTRDRPALLSGGLVRCGVCGSELYCDASGDRPANYRCSARGGGCGKISIVGSLIEADTTERVLARLTDAGYRRALGEALRRAGGVEAAQHRLDDYRQRLATLGEEFADGTIERDTLLAGAARARGNIKRAVADVERARVLVDLPTPSVECVVAWWEEASVRRQRDVIGALLDHVTVLSARGDDSRSGVDRLTHLWRD